MGQPAEIRRTTRVDLPVIITSDRGEITLESERLPYRLVLNVETAKSVAEELTKQVLLLETADDQVLGVNADGSRHDRAGPSD